MSTKPDQAQETSPPAFEVAAVSPVPYTDEVRDEILAGRRRATMTVTDSRVAISYLSLGDVVRRAFGVEPYAMSAPDWLEEVRFDIQATIPAGRRRDEVPAMLQALLIQRFGMATHRESRDVPAFVLVVGDKGHRMRESQPESDQSSGGAGEKASGTTASSAPLGPGKPFTMTMKTESNGTMTFRTGPDGTIESVIPKISDDGARTRSDGHFE